MRYQLKSKETPEVIQELLEMTKTLVQDVEKSYDTKYQVFSGEIEVPEDKWSHEIKIRKGNKIGVGIELSWEKENPSDVEIEVKESTKIGNRILYGVSIPFMLIGAYMAVNRIAPLDFLPGYKIAGGLGGVIAFIPGIIIAVVIKSFVLKKYKEENKELEEKTEGLMASLF